MNTFEIVFNEHQILNKNCFTLSKDWYSISFDSMESCIVNNCTTYLSYCMIFNFNFTCVKSDEMF